VDDVHWCDAASLRWLDENLGAGACFVAPTAVRRRVSTFAAPSSWPRSAARRLWPRVRRPSCWLPVARPRRIALSGLESLTPSERRVAVMAAEGPTNREIAQALFVTPKTVEVHVSNVYRKLGISSRSQLPAALAEPARA
jgi:DNA-binding NarL/FixJ family response regulator